MVLPSARITFAPPLSTKDRVLSHLQYSLAYKLYTKILMDQGTRISNSGVTGMMDEWRILWLGVEWLLVTVIIIPQR